MKKRFHSTTFAVITTITMLMQVFMPSVALAVDTTEPSEPDVTVESTAVSESEETSVEVIEIEEPSETTLVEYVEETVDLTETEVTEDTEEEIVSSETDADPTVEVVETVDVEETVVTETSETIESVETEETLETEEEIEYIVFDHYYSDINESLVNTTELFVITSDPSVFTRNTNVVSNYDNAYIIECESVEEARFVYSYYVDKVEFITDLSSVASVASPDDVEEIDETVPVESELSESSETTEATETTEVIEPTESQTEETSETTATETSETSETILEDENATEPTETENQEPDIADLSDLNNGSDAISNLNGIDTVHNDYSGYIALIDTGANAHANFTVLNGDPYDHNGHGSSMLSYIRSENPQAQVVSIKVSEDGRATAADIYAGFRLAIDLNVSVINFSMTAPDTAKNAVIRDIIQEALNAGIVVIGAAGNNGISATNFIPGCIDGVITVGAATLAGTKYRTSNYDADYYVVAESSSEATARLTGIYTAGNLEMYASAYYKVFETVGVEEYWYMPVYDDDFTVAFGPNATVASNATGVYSGTPCAPGTYYGTCTVNIIGAMTSGYDGSTASGFTANDITGHSGNSATFANWFNRNVGTMSIACAAAWPDGERSTGDGFATSRFDTTANYKAIVRADGSITVYFVSPGYDPDTTTDSNGQTVSININVSGRSGGKYVYTITDSLGRVWGPYNDAATVSEMYAKVSSLYSGKVTWSGYVGSFTDYPSGQKFRGDLTGGISPVFGHVRISKIDENGNGLAGATITLTGPMDENTRRITGAQGTPNWDASTNTYTFTTSTGIVEIEGLMPNSDYTFAETQAPANYDRVVTTASFHTNADGNIESWSTSAGEDADKWAFASGRATFTLTNGTTETGYGTFGITKTWSGTLSDSYRFFNSVNNVSFSIYGFNWSRENAEDWRDGGSMRGASARAEGTLNSAAAGNGNSHAVFWNILDYSGARGEVPEYYHCWGNDGTTEGWIRWSAGHSSFIGIPLDGYFVVTETWRDGVFAAEDERIFIETENASGWHEISNINGTHTYAAIYHVDRYTGITYLCDWDTLQHSRPLTFSDGESSDIYMDDYYYDLVDNEQVSAMIDVVKIDQTGLGVDGVRFELRSGDTNTVYATGTPGSVTGTTTDGYNIYDVNWNYSFLIAEKWTEIVQWGQPWEVDYARHDAVYNLRDTAGVTDDLIARIRDMIANPGNYADPTSDEVRDGDKLPVPAWVPSTFNPTTLDLNRRTATNAAVVGYLPYDAVNGTTYYIYEYIEDSNGNNIIGTNGYETPEGWTLSSDGTYFYQRVVVNGNHRTTPLTVECANNIQGKIDLSKVSLTGGPLSDLGFEIRNGNTVIATGSISAGATPETTGTGTATDYTYSATWTYTRNGTSITNDVVNGTGLGTFTVREYIPVSAVEDYSDISVTLGWTYGGTATFKGRNCYYWETTVTVNESNASDVQNVTAINEVHPTISTTLTDFADRHITVVGENIEFTDVVAYEDAYIGGSYIMHATLMDVASGQPIRDEDGNIYETDVPFTANTSSGTVNVTLTVNTAALVEATKDANGVVSYSPRSVVCFESMRLANGYEIANHNDITDEAQTVTIDNPLVETTLTSVQNIRSHAPVGETVTFVDTVTYTNLHVGETYTVTAYIYDQSNGQRLVDSEGLPFTGSTTFVPEEESGTVEVYIEINTASIIEAYVDGQGVVHEQTKNIVCYEYLYSDSGILIGGHTDIEDEGQTIEITPPEIGTTFTDLQTEDHETVSGRIVQVVDTVSYTGLHVGETYTLTCFLYDKVTGNQLVYSDGTLVVGTRTFEAETADGEIRVEFTIDTSDLLVNVFEREERTTVAFEYLRTENDILIAGHTDINDLPQGITPRLPELRTSIVDDQTGTHTGRLGAEVPFTDTVWYTNLNVGETYVMRGRIVDRDNPSIVYAEAEQEFTPQSREGTVQVHFTVDTSMVCDGSYEAHMVCFEQLWQLDTQNTGRGEVMLAHHEDVRDQGQTIDLYPEIGTQMTDPVTGCNYGLIGENVEFIDTVSYRNLHIGETYTVSGIIMDKQTGEPVLDRNGNPFTASTTFVPETSDGTVEVVYHVDTLYIISQIGQTINGVTIEAPREIVSFETITSTSGFDFEIHADIEDEGQTIILGDIRSGAGDVQTSTSWLAAGLTTIRDTVHYRGLGPVEYTVRGSLHYVNYDENGNPVDGGLIPARAGEITETEYTWTPTNHEGDINLDYRLDSTRFAGQQIIVFEELWYNGVCIISHEHYSDSNGNYGMNNLEQTVHVASVHTNAFSFQTGEQMLAYDEHATITDFVYYGNVEVGQRYFVEGTLWGCYTDEVGQIHSVPISAEDGGRVCSDVFTANEAEGVVEVLFTIDSTLLARNGYDYIVVTERLIHTGSNVCIANHSDFSDQAQTIQVPNVHTTATTETGHTLPEGANSDIRPVTVTDRVYYENLIPGKSYTVVGNLQYARTDDNGSITESGPLMQNGQPVTATKTFVPEASTGYIDLEFTVNAFDIMAKGYNKIVAFEEVYFGPEGIRVAVHADITDEDQTVYVPDIETTALGANGRHTVAATANTVINDRIVYTGLTVGREYRIETDLMSSRSGESIAHVTTVFVPTTSDGEITVSMTADLSEFTSGDRVVVFENCYDNSTGILIKSHMDWDDDDQTVTTGNPGTGIFDSNGKGYLAAAIGCVITMIGLGVSESIKKRKKNFGGSENA